MPVCKKTYVTCLKTAANVLGKVRAAIERARLSGECAPSGLGLTALSDELAQIACLRMLSLRGNMLTEFPPDSTLPDLLDADLPQGRTMGSPGSWYR